MRTILGMLVWCTALASNAAAPDSHNAEKFVVGMCAHLQRTNVDVPAKLDKLKELGVTALRFDATWRRIETSQGVYSVPASWDVLVNEALKRGISPLLVLAYGNPLYDGGDKPRSRLAIQAFSAYAAAVAAHFKGRVRRYEVWNEWEIGIGGTTPGTPEEYVALVKATYPALKSVDPSLEVLAGAFTDGGVSNGFLEKTVQLGLLNTADALSLHSYVYRRSSPKPEDWAVWMSSLENRLVQLTGKVQPFYVTEMGWPTYTGKGGISLEKQAQYISRLFLLARTMPFIKGIWWYNFQDDGNDVSNVEHNFGVVKSDLSLKPSFKSAKAIVPLVVRSEFLGQIDSAEGIHVLKFKDADGSIVYGAWTESDDPSTLRIKSNLARPPLVASLINAGGEVALPCQCSTTEGSTAAGCEASLQLTESPALVRTILSNGLRVYGQ